MVVVRIHDYKYALFKFLYEQTLYIYCKRDIDQNKLTLFISIAKYRYELNFD